MRRAFTLIELVVAIGILAIILSFVGVVFRVSTESQRLAAANAEVMQNLRVVTAQLNADFKGLIADYGGHSTTLTLTQTTNGRTDTINSDGISFFANGDFQSTGQYDGRTIVGNVASIYYGPPDANSYTTLPAPRDRILLRRQTILAPEASEAGSRWDGEYYRASLEQWRTNPPCTPAEWSRPPVIDPADLESQMPMYLARGVGDFTVEYLERGTEVGAAGIPWQRQTPGDTISPLAFKVTFTLYDSKGLLENGRTFTHIVLVGDS